MTINDILARFDRIKENAVDTDEKIRFLSELDGRFYREVVQKHMNPPVGSLPVYTAEDLSTELLIKEPYDSAYIHWLTAQVCYQQGEFDRYRQAMILFNETYDAFCRLYHSEHRPITVKFRFY